MLTKMEHSDSNILTTLLGCCRWQVTKWFLQNVPVTLRVNKDRTFDIFRMLSGSC
uniref:Uncharacterized protein n=1 Tax=Anguilla anguilla TaxID=7936 RepID=A0A0E9S0A7_ANGAN